MESAKNVAKDVFGGFKTFILRGNVIDLAVGVIIGASFGAIVTALVKDIITPLIAALGSQPDFSSLALTVNGSKILYGDFLNALITFLIQAATVYFAIVLPINALVARAKKAPAPTDPTSKKCSECLSEIPLAAKRCAHCAQPQA